MATGLLHQMYSERSDKDIDEVIRVVLVDSREAMREGLRQMLSGDENIQVVGEACHGREALEQVKTLCPDIVILDMEMSDTDGTGIITRYLRSASKPVNVIVLSDRRKLLAPAISAGAAAFLTKSISRSELIAAIRIIHLWRLVLFHDDRTHFALVKL
jgi:DNA-binding NarL/FixJ family response regulator